MAITSITDGSDTPTISSVLIMVLIILSQVSDGIPISKQKTKFGVRERATFRFPSSLAKKHRMDKPCRVAFVDDINNGDIPIRFLHYNEKDE
jgi:hypothetical protein